MMGAYRGACRLRWIVVGRSQRTQAVLVIACAIAGASCGRIGFDAVALGGPPGDGAGGDGGCPVAAGLDTVDCAPVAGCPVPAVCKELVALLHFDGDPAHAEDATHVHDFSGRGNDAMCVAPDCPVAVPTGGKFGGAFAYAEPDAFAIPNGPSVSLQHAVTMSAWFYPNTLTTSWRIIITKIQSTPLIANYGLPHNGDTLCVNFATSTGWKNHCTAGGATPGRWYHLVGVLDDDADRASLYVDGVKVLDEAEPAALEQDAGAVWIGWSPTNAGVDGRIDEVAIWNRALTAAEITALYP